MDTRIHERIMAAVIFAAALYFMNLSRSFPADSQIFPYSVLGLMMILAAVIFIRTFIGPRASKTAPPAKPFFENLANFWAAFGAMLGYILLLPILGYFSSSALFFISLTLILGYREWKKILLTISLFLGFVYFVFIRLFERPIPPEFFQNF
jgi:putative tricarboxylic transport membrane protein